MGSGKSSIYGSGSGSQPYAPTYAVVSEMLEKDKYDPDIYNPETGYFKNPKAVNLEDIIDGTRILYEGRSISGKFTYVMDENGNVIFGKRFNPNDGRKRSPHPTLIGGKNPEVQCAGMITFQKGRILSVDDRSGHFRPNPKSLEKVDAFLKNLYEKNPLIFDKNSKWSKENG